MMLVLRSLVYHGRIVILQTPMNPTSHFVLSVWYLTNTAYLVHSSSKRAIADISRQPYMHPNNGRSSCPTALLFTLCTILHLPFQTPTPSKNKRYMYLYPRLIATTLAHHSQPRLPFPNSTPPVAHGCHVSREIMGASEHFSREQETTSHKGLGGLRSRILARQKKKGVCGSGAGILVMGCIRHCAILESNAGTVSWCFDF